MMRVAYLKENSCIVMSFINSCPQFNEVLWYRFQLCIFLVVADISQPADEVTPFQRMPAHLEFEAEQDRLANIIERFPKPIIVPPQFLAEAGLYYTGTADGDDEVTCYWCKGLISEWDEGDDPWVEHAK